MTTNNDGVQAQNPADQQTQTDPANAGAAPQGQQQQQQQEPGPQFTDPDDTELSRAIAEVQAEEAAANGGQATQAEGGTQPAQQQGEQQGQASGDQPAAMIPKARLDEALGKQHAAELEAARWRGIAEARGEQKPQPQGNGQQQPNAQPQQPTADQRLAAIQTKQDELAAKFDNGEITYAELTKQSRELNNQEQGIREEILLAKVKPAKPDQPSQSDLYLEERTDEIATAHPWVNVYEEVGTPLDWKYVRDIAFQSLMDKGVDPATPSGLLALREEAASVMDRLGPVMMADKAKAKGIAIPSQQQPGQQQQQQPGGQGGQQQPPLTPIQALRKGKLDVQARQPPNLTQMTGTTGDTGLPTDAAIEAMGEDAYDRLTPAARNRLLGISEQ